MNNLLVHHSYVVQSLLCLMDHLHRCPLHAHPGRNTLELYDFVLQEYINTIQMNEYIKSYLVLFHWQLFLQIDMHGRYLMSI